MSGENEFDTPVKCFHIFRISVGITRITKFDSQIFENGDCEARLLTSFTHVKKNMNSNYQSIQLWPNTFTHIVLVKVCNVRNVWLGCQQVTCISLYIQKGLKNKHTYENLETFLSPNIVIFCHNCLHRKKCMQKTTRNITVNIKTTRKTNQVVSYLNMFFMA